MRFWLLFAAALVHLSAAEINTLSEAEKAHGFELLFDGRTAEGWLEITGAAFPATWKISGGALQPVAGLPGFQDIRTTAEFTDFELRFEWRISPKGNSGVKYRLEKVDRWNLRDGRPGYHARARGHEYQIVDDALNPDALSNPKNTAGALYGRIAPAAPAAMKPGEWNDARIIVRGRHLEHWLNNVKVADCECAAGEGKPSPIALQNHDSDSGFRNLRIRRLPAHDADRDGIDDKLEEKVLARFAPRFQVDSKDCDVLPSTFAPNTAEPRSLGRTGQIYGQVFPSGPFLEVHYYHVWAHDCGRRSHPLDAEHVSALVTPDGSHARFWFASAHQDTVCDSSYAAKAAVLNAETSGPAIWVSAGKHASYFSLETCRGGCGADQCGRMKPLPLHPIINIGEPGAPLNGAAWTAKALAAKMASDFPPELMAALPGAATLVGVNHPPRGVRTAIKIAAIPGDRTGSALDTAQKNTDSSLRRAHKAVKDWFKRWEK